MVRVFVNTVEVLADLLVEDAWGGEKLWPGLASSEVEGRPVGKDIEQAKANLSVALQSAYEDWLEGENNES